MKQNPKKGDRYVIGRNSQGGWRYRDGDVFRCIHCDRILQDGVNCKCCSVNTGA